MANSADYEMGIVENVLRLFSDLRNQRGTLNSHWEEVASLVLPTYRNTFYYGAMNTPGMKKSELQIDASGMLALTKFAAICDSMLTPQNTTWHDLEPDDDALLKDRATRLWFEQVTKILFKLRYSTTANFSAQNQASFQSLGAFGNTRLFIDSFYDPIGRRPGFRYKAIPLGEIYTTENHQGMYDGFIRIIHLIGRQLYQVEEWRDKLPEPVLQAREKQSSQRFTVLHAVSPRDDYDPYRLDSKGMPWRSCYILMDTKTLLQEGGYYTFPLAASRYQQAPGEPDGRGPAMDVLPSLKTLNAQKKTFLKQAHRAADPVLLTNDDGLMNLSLKPGAINKGGMNSDGKPLIGVLPSGEIQVSLEMMNEEKQIIQDAFLTSLFQVIFDNPTMTATQVIEIVNQKGILIAPTVGRQMSEYLGPLIDRELDLAAQLRLLPPMPPLLREAGGQYSVRYTSPLAKARRAGEAAGFMRTLEGVKELVAITGDPSLLDVFSFDRALPDIADIQSVPISWMASADEVGAKRQNRAQAAQRQQQIQAAPAAAAMIKANAAAGKAGTPIPTAPASVPAAPGGITAPPGG